MKAARLVLLVLAIAVVSFVALSQATESVKIKSSVVNNDISYDEEQDCVTTTYLAEESVYGNVTKTRDTYGSCYNPLNKSHYPCVNGTEQYAAYELTGSQRVPKSDEKCTTRSFVVNYYGSQKEVDFSGWGVCVQSMENDCAAITCGTLEGGSARNGIFNGCDGGKVCKKFLFCDGHSEVLYKAALGSFVRQDPTYRLPELDAKGAD
jgi:hypothetical protein